MGVACFSSKFSIDCSRQKPQSVPIRSCSNHAHHVYVRKQAGHGFIIIVLMKISRLEYGICTHRAYRVQPPVGSAHRIIRIGAVVASFISPPTHPSVYTLPNLGHAAHKQHQL